MPELDTFGRATLSLTLEINKHIDGYIDSYYGPADLKAEIEAGQKKSPALLMEDVKRLRDLIPDGDPQRRDYLITLVRAMETTLRILNGEQIPYLDEVRAIYDIDPHLVDEDVFTAAHRELDTLLPGSLPLRDRVETWRSQYDIPNDRLLEVIEVAKSEARQRTAALFDLVPGESIEVSMTRDQPWGAYNWFKGNAHSHIEFNTDIPVSGLAVLDTFAHEGYPGHHTEHSLKEQVLYRDQGYAECASALLHSPSAVIAEGIATTALEIIFPGSTGHQFVSEVLLPAARLPAAEPDFLARIARARESVRAVSCNAAILLHGGKLNEEQAVEYIQTYALSTETRARKSASFISHPLFRSYIFTYTEGYTLIEQAVKGGDKLPLFRRLLTEEIPPSAWGGIV
jgi:hypothetical protein